MKKTTWLRAFVAFIIIIQPFYLVSGKGNSASAKGFAFAFGDGTEESPYQIRASDELNEVRYYLDKHFVLMNDIDLGDYENWEPIGGNLSQSFRGSLNGNGYSIKNLTIRKPESTHIGLFSMLQNAMIKNLKLDNVHLESFGYVGGLAGVRIGGTISNVSVTGTVSGPTQPNDFGYVGGLVGSNISGQISDSSAHVTVTGNLNVGGLVGYNGGGSIMKSYATGDIFVASRMGGGLVGANNSNAISDSYATGNVTGLQYIGALVGNSEGAATLHNSYASGKVICNMPLLCNAGGLVGGGDLQIVDSYFNNEINPYATSGRGVGLSTADMQKQESFVGWDFENIWDINPSINNGFPTLLPLSIVPPIVVLPAVPNVSADDENNIILGADDTMEYSKDNGASWTSYFADDAETFYGEVTVWVRVKAVGNIPAGEVKIIEFTVNGTENVPENQQVERTVFASSDNSYLLDQDRQLWSLGFNALGTLGNSSNMMLTRVPIKVELPTDIVDVSAFKNHVAAIDSIGDLYTWGWNDDKQLGIGSDAYAVSKPGKVAKDSSGNDFGSIVAVAVGLRHTLAVKEDGTVWSWGINNFGQLGTGDEVPSERPIQVPGLSNIIAVTAADDSSMAVDKDGRVWSWGSNNMGQLGHGHHIALSSPRRVEALTDVKEIEIEEFHTVALKNDGTVWSWGANFSGQLGDGTTERTLVPVKAKNLNGIKTISASRDHTIALDVNGNVWTWGSNADGVLGQPDVTSIVTEPVKLTSIDHVVSISAGTYHSLFQKDDLTYWGVGKNERGAIGLEDGKQITPVEITISNPDLEAVNLAKGLLEIGYSVGDSIESVKGNLGLPTIGASDVEIRWVTSNADYVDTNGGVHRPADQDEQVVLTAILSKNEASAVKEFIVMVKKEEQIDNGNGGTVPDPNLPGNGGDVDPTPPNNGDNGTTPNPPNGELEKPVKPAPEVSTPSKPTTELIFVDVDGEDGFNLAKTKITRTTEPNGAVKDKVSMTEAIAKDTVAKAKEKGVETARIIIPDTDDKVSEIMVEIPKSALKQLRDGKLKLEISTANGVISIPTSSISGFNDDLYFRIIPLKSETEQKKVEERAKAEKVIKEAVKNEAVQVLGRPMEIETNMQSRNVMIVLPIEASLPKDARQRKEIVDHLRIFIEHSDGTKELIKGKLTKMPDGSAGIEFSVTKFSTFTMIYAKGWTDQQEESIGQVVHKPYIFGDVGKFRPNSYVTRVQMAAMLARNIEKQSQTDGIPFKDVKRSHWAYENVMQMKNEKLMFGITSSEFNPQGDITRGQMALIAYRWIQQECQNNSSAFAYCTAANSEKAIYKDVSKKHQAYEAISVLAANQIMTGFEDKTFKPNEKLTRAQAVKVINRLFKRGPLTGAAELPFKDVKSSHWAYEEIAEAAMEHTASVTPEGKEKNQ